MSVFPAHPRHGLRGVRPGFRAVNGLPARKRQSARSYGPDTFRICLSYQQALRHIHRGRQPASCRIAKRFGGYLKVSFRFGLKPKSGRIPILHGMRPLFIFKNKNLNLIRRIVPVFCACYSFFASYLHKMFKSSSSAPPKRLFLSYFQRRFPHPVLLSLQ